MAQIEFKNIKKEFEVGKPATLNDISFDVKDKEFVSLLGPSGCGKTTLLRILAGLEFQTAGQILIGEDEVSKKSSRDRNIAFVFQNYALYPHFTVEENISLGLHIRKINKDEIKKRVHDTSTMLGIDHVLEKKPKTLSGGQRQRVALARALVRNPKVFLLDEPLSNLDAKLRDKTRSELKILFKKIEGTVIYVTHDQIEAMTLSDRVVILNKGFIQQIGTPEEIYQKPQNTFVAGFIGTPPMNLLPRAELCVNGFALPQVCSEKTFTVGIRPEDICLSIGPQKDHFECNVVLAEMTGFITFLTLETPNGVQFKAIALKPEFAHVKKVYCRFPDEKIHCFNQEGKRV